MDRSYLSPRRILRHSQSAKERRGVAAVETALVFPMLLLVVFGTITTSQLIYFRKSMVVASSEGLRLASQRDSTSQAVSDRVSAILTSQRISNATVTLTPSTIELLSPGSRVDLSVKASFQGFGIGPFGKGVSYPVNVTLSILRE
jgi:Flp pilus assembly protein TadG